MLSRNTPRYLSSNGTSSRGESRAATSVLKRPAGKVLPSLSAQSYTGNKVNKWKTEGKFRLTVRHRRRFFRLYPRCCVVHLSSWKAHISTTEISGGSTRVSLAEVACTIEESAPGPCQRSRLKRLPSSLKKRWLREILVWIRANGWPDEFVAWLTRRKNDWELDFYVARILFDPAESGFSERLFLRAGNEEKVTMAGLVSNSGYVCCFGLKVRIFFTPFDMKCMYTYWIYTGRENAGLIWFTFH